MARSNNETDIDHAGDQRAEALGEAGRRDRDTVSDDGMVTAEYAMTTPAIIALVIFLVTMLMGASFQMSVQNGVREAARAMALGKSETQARHIAKANAGADAFLEVSGQDDILNLSLTRPGPGLFGLLNIDFTATASTIKEPGGSFNF